jgi:hypothetical protein
MQIPIAGVVVVEIFVLVERPHIQNPHLGKEVQDYYYRAGGGGAERERQKEKEINEARNQGTHRAKLVLVWI